MVFPITNEFARALPSNVLGTCFFVGSLRLKQNSFHENRVLRKIFSCGQRRNLSPLSEKTPLLKLRLDEDIDILVQQPKDHQRETEKNDRAEVALTKSEQKHKGQVPWPSYLMLNVVAVIWGTQHAIIKLLMDSGANPALVNFSRFFVAAVLLLPWAPGMNLLERFASQSKESNTSLPSPQQASVQDQWIAGLELGLWIFLGYSFQSIGLETTTANRSAFLLYLNVKFVPFFAWVLLGRSISIGTWVSAFTACIGTFLLCADNNVPLNIGDAWCLAAAAASAMFILRLEKYSNVCGTLQLTSANFITVALLCGIWTAFQLEDTSQFQNLMTDPFMLLPILYLAVVTTALTTLLQTIGQKSVPAEQAAIIYAADPVYGAFFSWLILGETLTTKGWIGAVLIIAAAVYAQKREEKTKA